ncbi:hypothetical protein [Adhaeribacter aquaticus]|uniref:hypothetical protein n=1 Tax=Adhaeribacter aquaticus TaxID=299567 RepID=UPI00047D4087|nr:hypothetical protein [Adhaeribacter aquaticus]
MQSMISSPELIEKEQIPDLKFGQEDVLKDPQARKKRLQDVSRATSLGNGYHGKVEITFQTSNGEQKRVVTTIWDFDQEYIILKSGASMPVKAVTQLEFF